MSQDVLPPRLLELLRSNEQLDGEEVATAKCVLDGRRRTFEGLRQKVSAINEELAELEKQKAKIQGDIVQHEEVMEQCERLLSPARLLPPELLPFIFIHTLPTPAERYSALLNNRIHAHRAIQLAPTALAQVCRVWRSVAHSTPELWTSFSVGTFAHTMALARGASLKQQLQAYFARGGSLPRSLDVHFGMELELDTTGHFVGTVNSVLDACQVHRLALGSSNITDLIDALRMLNANGRLSKQFEQVHSLVLRETDGSDVSHDAFPEGLTANALEFSRLRCAVVAHHREASLTPHLLGNALLPWGQLTHLAITHWMSQSTWTRIFTQSCALSHGIFYISEEEDPDVEEAPGSGPSEYPSLQDLTIVLGKAATSAAFTFPAYTFPALATLRLGSYRPTTHGMPFNWHNIAGDLYHLTTLSLHHMTWEVGAADVVQLLFATPNLHTLSMGISTDYDDIFEHFQVDWDGQALLPKLKSLTIDCADSSWAYEARAEETNVARKPYAPVMLALTVSGFADVVKERWRPSEDIAQLECVALHLPPSHAHMLAKIKQRLRAEIKEGLVADIGTSVKTRWDDPFGASWDIWENEH